MSVPKSINKEIAQLRGDLELHNYQYHVLDAPLISDREYDKLFQRLKDLEAAHPELITPDSPTQRVGEKPIEGFEHVKHAVPMLSIDNTYTADEVRKFDERVAKGLDGVEYAYIVDPKIDGVSATLRYEAGRLTLAATRGDGRTGDDITANARTIRAIPLKLRGKDWPGVLEVRGEIYWPREAFDRHNEIRVEKGLDPFANPRNATSGTLKSLDSQAIADRGLSFIAHGAGEIDGASFETASAFFKTIGNWGVPTTAYQRVCKTIDDVIAFIDEWDEQRHALEYETDGLVIKVDPGQAHCLKISHRIHHADGVAIAFLHIGNDRYVDCFDDIPSNHQPFRLGHQGQIWLAQKRRFGRIAPNIDGVKAGLLNQTGR